MLRERRVGVNSAPGWGVHTDRRTVHNPSTPLGSTEEVRDRMATRDEIADELATMTLFADLNRPQLLGVAGRFEEAFFSKGERVLRQGLSGAGFYIILAGEATVVGNGQVWATLARGEFFGEISVLLGEAPIADIVAATTLRCVVLAGPAVQTFILDHPPVAYRMLQTLARRFRARPAV